LLDDRQLAVGIALLQPASIELFDLLGRKIAAREVGSFGPGRHSIGLAGDLRLAGGLYLLRLRQGAATRTARLTVLP